MERVFVHGKSAIGNTHPHSPERESKAWGVALDEVVHIDSSSELYLQLIAQFPFSLFKK